MQPTIVARRELDQRARARRSSRSELTGPAPADRRPGHAAIRRRRGAGPLAAPDARPGRAGRVHRAGRGDRPRSCRWAARCCETRGHRGPARGAGADILSRASTSRPASSQQPDFLDEVEARPWRSPACRRARWCWRSPSRPCSRDPQAQRRQAHRAARAGRPDRDRRLRHGLLVADLPAPLPGRHPEDRQGLHRTGHRGDPGMGVRGRHPGARPPAGARGRGGRRRGQGQLARLRGMGCELGQGFYFARPAPLDQLIPRTDRSLARWSSPARGRVLRNADIPTD